jgi:hypothetical protein
MAEPTTQFRLIPQNTTVAALDTAVERLAAIAGESVVSTGVGNEVDFGEVDISAGAANSGVKTILWNVTVNGGNTLAQTFKLWIPAASIGFDIAGSVVKVQPLSGDNPGPGINTEDYVVNGVVGSYTWATMVESEPGAINVWDSNEDTSVDITTPGTTDDAVMWAWYLAIADGETTGIYKGTAAGYEIQFSFKYSYS